jgi:hypothetical protein
MAFHVLVGTTDDGQKYLTKAVREKTPVTWVVPKKASVEDDVFLFVGTEFVGRALVATAPKPGKFRDRAVYRAGLKNVSLFSKPIPLASVAKHVPDWGFLRQYSKTTHTPKSDVAGPLLRALERLAPRTGTPTHGEVPLPEELPDGFSYAEGAARTVAVNAYERSSAARDACVARWGVKCTVCSFDFESVYGDYGRGFIHVHHLTPLSDVRNKYKVDPEADMRPVCPNCHAMIHRTTPPLSIEDLRGRLRK